MKYSLIISCEHAGNEVPAAFSSLFVEPEVLQSHEGWDPGAWTIAQQLSQLTNALLFGCPTTRLLIEPNRSIGHPNLFSSFSKGLPEQAKASLINGIYLPYRQSVINAIRHLPTPVVHLSIHSFTPIWKGEARAVDIGLLFDPARNWEATICNHFRPILHTAFPQLLIRDNEPYLGTDDGFTTFLRTIFANDEYAGIEIEIKQSLSHLASEIAAAVSKAAVSIP